MGLFGGCEHCADYRAQRDRAQQELSALLSEQAALVKDALALKRAEMGLPPAGFEPKDPTSILGPRTVAAIEQMSAGYADVRSHLMNWAITQANAAGPDSDGLDDALAEAIQKGDTT